MDRTLKIQAALSKHLDCSDIEGKSRFLLLSEGEKAEVLRWVDMLATGLLAVIPGQSEPVQVDEVLATRMIREVWQASCARRQQLAAEVLAGAGPDGSVGALDAMIQA